MSIELLPAPLINNTKWHGLEHITGFSTTVADLTFLYIGESSYHVENLSSGFQGGYAAETFLEAQHLISQLSRTEMPDVIFIDLKPNKTLFSRFRSFLKEFKLLSGIVVLQNEELLCPGDIQLVQHHDFIDDVVNLNTEVDSLARKVKFLKMVKTNQKKNPNVAATRVRKAVSRQSRAMYVKRVIDVVFASLVIILLLPVFILIAIAIRIDSKGPIIYTSLRAGRGYKIFKFYKFRTMIPGADKKLDEFSHLNQYDKSATKAKFLKISNDPRVTRLGKLLRNTSLDELPQLFNVLKGDMSLVGSRPLPLYEATTLTTNEHVERFMAPAGITGLWQIKKRGKSDMSTEERISLDISYARRYSVIYDFWIVANTPGALIQKNNV